MDGSPWDEVRRLEKENIRLREALDGVNTDKDHAIKRLKDENRRLRRAFSGEVGSLADCVEENKRLKEALDRVCASAYIQINMPELCELANTENRISANYTEDGI